MRASPSSMRSRPTAPVHLVALTLLALAPLACGDGGDEPATPTTTSPSSPATAPGDDEDGDEEGGGAEGRPGATGGGPDGASDPGDADGALTTAEAGAELTALLAQYRDAVAGAAADGRLDEAALVALGRVFSGPRAAVELRGLQQAGAEALNATPTVPTVSDVELVAAESTCAGGTATIDGIATFVTVPIEVVQPYYFRLVPAPEGASGPGWRLDFLGFSTNGVPLDGEITCD